jgi:hypothetical protein
MKANAAQAAGANSRFNKSDAFRSMLCQAHAISIK